MTATTLFRVVLRDTVGPALRAVGFTGSGTTWTLKAPNNDVAIVNAQSSQASTAEEVQFVVNLAVAPASWRAWRNTLLHRPEPRAPKEHDGLWRDRLHPRLEVPRREHGTEPWWVIRDERDARACADDVVGQLIQHAVPRLRQLLDRDTLLVTVRTGDFGFLYHDPTVALAVLVSDRGPSAELDDLLARIAADPDDRHRSRNEQLIEWIHRRVGPPDHPATQPT